MYKLDHLKLGYKFFGIFKEIWIFVIPQLTLENLNKKKSNTFIIKKSINFRKTAQWINELRKALLFII